MSLGEFCIQRSSVWGFPPSHRALPAEHQAQILSNTSCILGELFRTPALQRWPGVSSRELKEPRLLVSTVLLIPGGTSFYFFSFALLFFFPLNYKKQLENALITAKSCFTDVLLFMFQLSLIKIEMPWSFTNAHSAQKLQAVLFQNLLTAGRSLPFLSN